MRDERGARRGPARAPRVDTEAIRARHPIAEWIEGAGVALRRSGRHLVGLCPFHEDRRPSLVVYPESASFFCFGCDQGGDVIDFVGRLRGTGFLETAALLAAAGGGTGADAAPPEGRSPPSRPRRVPDPEEAAAVDLACSLYTEQLERSRRARAYLASRGLDAQTALRLRLGLAGSSLLGALRERGVSPDAARRVGLLHGGRDALSGRVVIPDLDASGRATWLTGRSLDGSEPRYRNLSLPTPLLGLAAARVPGARAVLLTEGPFDWLTARAWGLRAVALLGTHLSAHALDALGSFEAVYVALDSDPPGRLAAERLRSALGVRARLVSLPRGAHDLNELGSGSGGREAFLRALQQASEREQEPCPTSTQHERSDRAA